VITRDHSPADEGVRFLAEAGQALAASLDWEQTLVQVARLAVPALADWCIVDVLEEDGVTIKQVAVSATDPGKEELLREMRSLYPAFATADSVGLDERTIHAKMYGPNIASPANRWAGPNRGGWRLRLVIAIRRDIDHSNRRSAVVDVADPPRNSPGQMHATRANADQDQFRRAARLLDDLMRHPANHPADVIAFE